jgi:DNA replication protein DnaC
MSETDVKPAEQMVLKSANRAVQKIDPIVLPVSLANILEGAREGVKNRKTKWLSDTALAEVLKRWTANPALVGKEYDQFVAQGFVSDGFIHGENSSVRCPVTVYREAHQKFILQFPEMMKRAGIGTRYMGMDWATLRMPNAKCKTFFSRLQAAGQRIAKIIESGESLLLLGDPSCGKTQTLILLVKDALRAGFTGMVCNLGREAMLVRSGYGTDSSDTEGAIVERLGRVDLLGLDDLGAGETDNAKLERRLLYLILEERYNRGLPTLMTSNLSVEQFTERVGTRLLNRLQPLEIVFVDHGINFRVKENHKSLWGSE